MSSKVQTQEVFMERSLLNAVMGGVLGMSTLGGLAFVSAAPGPPAPPRAEGTWRLLDSVTYENIAILPVVNSSTHDTSTFLTLDEGLSSGDVVVSEQGASDLDRTRDDRPIPASTYTS